MNISKLSYFALIFMTLFPCATHGAQVKLATTLKSMQAFTTRNKWYIAGGFSTGLIIGLFFRPIKNYRKRAADRRQKVEKAQQLFLKAKTFLENCKACLSDSACFDSGFTGAQASLAEVEGTISALNLLEAAQLQLREIDLVKLADHLQDQFIVPPYQKFYRFLVDTTKSNALKTEYQSRMKELRWCDIC